jgi:hypothetical protein
MVAAVVVVFAISSARITPDGEGDCDLLIDVFE